MTLVLSSLTKEYVRVPISATEDGATVDPTSDTVAFAFTAVGAEPSSWSNGDWETDAAAGVHYARIIVGAGGVSLADGLYDIWVKVTDSPEIPVRRVGRLRVT